MMAALQQSHLLQYGCIWTLDSLMVLSGAEEPTERPTAGGHKRQQYPGQPYPGLEVSARHPKRIPQVSQHLSNTTVHMAPSYA